MVFSYMYMCVGEERVCRSIGMALSVKIDDDDDERMERKYGSGG
jgi:hypothetical protein